jgi:hypothetical protein
MIFEMFKFDFDLLNKNIEFANFVISVVAKYISWFIFIVS